MYEDDTFSLLVLLVVLVLLVLVPFLGWQVYDGYTIRYIPSEERAKIEAHAKIVPNTEARHALVVSIDNKSEFVIRKLTVSISFYAKGLVREPNSTQSTSRETWTESGGCLRASSQNFSLPPKRSGTNWCTVPLSAKASTILLSEGYEEYTWSFLDVSGHHLPMRIVKAPIDWLLSLSKGLMDWLSSLFERVEE